MAYDEGLAQRLREVFAERSDVEEKKMFGGLCFMVSRHMCCGIVGETLMVRVGPDYYEDALAKQYVNEMDFTGRAMKGMVYVAAAGIESDADLSYWVALASGFVDTLPPKQPK